MWCMFDVVSEIVVVMYFLICLFIVLKVVVFIL